MTSRADIVSRLIFATVLLCAGMSGAAHAEKRVALVIGNSAYRAVPALQPMRHGCRIRCCHSARGRRRRRGGYRVSLMRMILIFPP
jgi:hypothetical protein